LSLASTFSSVPLKIIFTFTAFFLLNLQEGTKINQLVETGTPISDETYVPLHPGQSAMSITVVTSTSRKPRFVTDANNRTIGYTSR
jgi:hypothetical protein